VKERFNILLLSVKACKMKSNAMVSVVAQVTAYLLYNGPVS